MRKRKLITQTTMQAIATDLSIGVPLARAMRNSAITMSRPAVAKLVKHYSSIIAEDPNTSVTRRYDSLFPDWLVTDEQEQPDNMCYAGYFPLGAWVWTV